MKRYKCPAAQANKKAPMEFYFCFVQIQQKTEHEPITSTTVLELHSALLDWLWNHIMRHLKD